MPRLPSSLLRRAQAIDPLLPSLLRPCRTLQAAQNELRWLREHLRDDGRTRRNATVLRKLVRERASGKPLQYILGTEYFGDLEIQCRPGVLIPRQETAASVTHLVNLLRNSHKLPFELRVLDLCTGTGCIPLLFQHELSSARKDIRLELLGVDISNKALALARHNAKHVEREHRDNSKDCKSYVDFIHADILSTTPHLSLKTALAQHAKPPHWDILISNPPYISPSAYWKTTTRSVRGFEPTLALVPPAETGYNDIEQGDRFYPRLLEIACDVGAKVALFEVADLAQAGRVARMARELGVFDGVEIWRDHPDHCGSEADESLEECGFPVLGSGNGRSVLFWRGVGAEWLGKSPST